MGRGISPATLNVASGYFHWKIFRKIEQKEISSCLIPRLLVVFTGQLEILVTPQGILGCFVLQHGYGLDLFHKKNSDGAFYFTV